MKKPLALFIASLCLLFSACHRPVAYFQPTPHTTARLSVTKPKSHSPKIISDSIAPDSQLVKVDSGLTDPVIASLNSRPITPTTDARLERRVRRMQSLLAASTPTTAQQPKPKPQKKLKLGNRIRQSLGMRLRPELNWWQRISWKLKAAVIVVLVAVVFAILHITILAIIFGVVGAFLLITGLKKSFKVRRPWF